VRKLAKETPAVLVLFDMLLDPQAGPIMERPLSERRRMLEAFFAANGPGTLLRLSPRTLDRRKAARWLEKIGGALDGVVAQRIDGDYRPGERVMLKVKNLRTADCVVGGFRYASSGPVVGSLLLGLYDDQGLLDHVGFTSAIPARERRTLTAKLESLREAPGFTGKAPGGPSRWSTERSAAWEPVRPTLVVEVRYDHVTGDRFRHGTKLVRWRPDKAPRQCTFEQLGRTARPGALIRSLVAT
jgi:ATP-dependent DNA ligase